MPNHQHTIEILNRLLAIHNRSLPVYLSSAQPWLGRDGARPMEVLGEIARDHRATVVRVEKMIVELEGIVRHGEFPMKYTGWHDLSVEFLVDRCIECQRLDIARIEECVRLLAGSPRAKVLAEEALGEAKAHLEALEELKHPKSAAAT